MRRGDVWWANLGEPLGSGPGYRHPTIVISTDAFNESRISTVIVVLITFNLRLAVAPGNVRLGLREAGLPKESIVNVSQVLTLDKGRLLERIGHVPGDRMAEVKTACGGSWGCDMNLSAQPRAAFPVPLDRFQKFLRSFGVPWMTSLTLIRGSHLAVKHAS